MKLEAKVGAFFIGTIAVLGILILRTEKLELFGKRNGRELMTEFPQVAGLNPQSAVRIAGVRVGQVQRIEIANGKARVILGLPEDMPIYADAQASLSAIGILGEKYIELDPGTPGAGPFRGGDQLLRSKSAMSLDNMMETLGLIAKDVKGITQALNESIGGESGRQKLDEIVDNIRVLTGEFRSMAQENHGAINRTMANTEAISNELRVRLPKLAQQFEDLGKNLNDMVVQNKPELNGLMVDVRKLAQGFQSTSDNIKSITDKMNRGEGTIGKLLNDEATIKKINAAVDNVNDLMGGIKNLDLRLDMGAARWSSRGDSYTGIDIELAPRKDYWYQLGFHSTPDGKINESERTTTKIDPVTGLPVSVLERSRFVTTDQTFTVNAQFAKRLGQYLVLSAGIVEGKGGGGAELRFLDDRLRLGGLAYDFTKRDGKDKPRYRVTGSYQFWKGLYVQAGGQDLANKDLRTFFAGGGIRWKDEDLKKLVGLASAAK